jgi:hypothetical protein
MSCHGPKYRAIYIAWRKALADRTAALAKQMKRSSAALGDAVSAALTDARVNLDLVVRGHGVHNVRYAHALLDRSHDDMNAARVEHGLARLAKPWVEIPYESPCLSCHQGIETRRAPFAGRDFPHAPHLVRAKVECVTCHLPHEQRTSDDSVRFRAEGCDSCHHREPLADCLGCHSEVRESPVASPLGEFDHAFHLDDLDQSCTDCHALSSGRPVELQTDICTGCH